MRQIFSSIIPVLLLLLPDGVRGQNIFRFEHIGTEQGLSQNTGSSILFDSKGFMWVGTMNGLNRYDGYEFKTFKGQTENTRLFTNNRVTKLWEDRKGFIWVETYDGYYHFFNPVNETFTTVPTYEDNISGNNKNTCFLQYSENEIILGSSRAGIFFLEYDGNSDTYRISQYLDRGNISISNNNVRFLFSDKNHNLWIGTKKGVNILADTSKNNRQVLFGHQFVNMSFTTVCEYGDELWFGTEEDGIVIYDQQTSKYRFVNKTNSNLPSYGITLLHKTKNGRVIIGLRSGGAYVTGTDGKNWTKIPFHGKSLTGVYEDRKNQVWLTAAEFGVTRMDTRSLHSGYYMLTPEETRHLTDLERPQFYEDRKNNLWIGLHGGGLGLYHREDDRFEFFRNDPKDPNSISSNIIHSIAEDYSGQLWLGTGQFLGGIEKVILENPAFKHYLLEDGRKDMLDNVVRAIVEDRNEFLWVATKAGRLYLLDKSMNKVAIFDSLPGIGKESVRNNIYSLFNDKDGYLWIGSKGDGLSVSTKPIPRQISDYPKLRYRRFKFSPDDSTTLANNNIYSVCQDSNANIWVGTYGNGLNLIQHPRAGDIRFIRINQQNSNLTSNLVRYLHIDKRGNLWVATAYGLNMLEKKNIQSGNYRFRTFLRDPDDDNSLGYNDVIHIFEDSKGRFWLGTFGAGADMLEIEKDPEKVSFKHYFSENARSNDVIFGILEDTKGNIWFSSENGLIKTNPETGNVEIYNKFNGLNFNNFSENTCFKRKDGSLCFGGFAGLEHVFTDNLAPEQANSRIELTSFQLFNKDVPVNQKGSPLKKSISFTEEITLSYNQSSFSIDFSALDFLDPEKVSYSYKLDNFENEWNNVGNQHKATYTNLSSGKYIFRVKSLKNNEAEIPDERILYITIKPPWWKTIPAYFAYVVLITAVTLIILKTATRLSRYRNELLVEKKINDVKLQFFTDISHEIRTPLTLIIGPIEDMLSASGISQRNRTLMEIIRKNARRMLYLTSQLLDFRKIQNNKMVLKIKEIDIIEFTREIFESFIPLAKHKAIHYEFQPETESCCIFGDPGKLDTIIYNILSNAIKFTGEGKKVNVSVRVPAKDDFIDICISDEGPGIPQKNLSDIFTRYTILSNRDLAGTGIGLSLSYELAKLHHGDILISSVEGIGSTFTIRLLKGRDHFGEAVLETEKRENQQDHFEHQAKEIEEIQPVDYPDQATPAETRYLLLIVEDNREILDYISQALKSTFTCVGARNGEEGLQIAQKMNPDVIITDILMPGMNGMEMTRRLKEDFNTSHIPVIMLTSKTDMSDQIAGIETGAEAYVLKPFNVEYLRAMANNFINQRAKVITWFTGKKDFPVEPLKMATRDDAFLKQILQFIEEHYETGFSIDALSESCCVSRTVLYNKIKGLTGLSPLEFVRKIKLKIAVQLLGKGYGVSEVAYKTGFSDVKYFSRQFKAQYGISPSKQKTAG